MPATPHPLLRQLAWAWLAQAVATLVMMAALAPMGELMQDIAAEAIARGARADVRAIDVIAQSLRGISLAFGVVALAGFAGALALWRQRSRDLVQVACVPMLLALPPLGLGLAILTWWALRRPDGAAALRDAAAPQPLASDAAPAAPAPAPTPPPTATDLAHLRQLAIGHWVMAALQLLPLGIMALQALMLAVVFGRAGQPGGPPPVPDGVHLLFGAVWTWLGVVVVVTAAMNIAAARALGRGRGLALVQACTAVNALQVPFGLALAIPTALVTQRPAVAAALAAGPGAPRG